MAMKKTTPPTSGIMKYSPVKTKVNVATGSGSTAASKGASAVKKQPVTSTKPVAAKKLPAKAPTTKGVTNLPEVTVTAKRTTTATPVKKTVSKDPYRYFMGPTDMSKPTKEVTKAVYEKGGMPRVKIAATDTATINNLTRSRGNMSSKGYTPLMTKTNPTKKKTK